MVVRSMMGIVLLEKAYREGRYGEIPIFFIVVIIAELTSLSLVMQMILCNQSVRTLLLTYHPSPTP